MRLPALILLAFATGLPVATGQRRIYRFAAARDAEGLGYAVAAAGDVDADGWPDALCGAPWSDEAAKNAGKAVVRSGRDGRVLFVFWGAGGDELGSSLATGDFDRDGTRDFVLGAPRLADVRGRGAVSVRSGRDGRLLLGLSGDSPGDHFGFSVASLGDVNADGHDDFAVGAPWDDDGGKDAGRCTVYSGRDAKRLFAIDGSVGDSLGWAVAAAGDIDGDRRGDLIVGTRGRNVFAGYALLVSGATGRVIRAYAGAKARDLFGASVANAGDIDCDGVADQIIGANATGAVTVFSGKTGRKLASFAERAVPEFATTWVGGAGDLDADGVGDLAIGTPVGGVPSTGFVTFRSGRDGHVMFQHLGGLVGPDHGWSVAPAGDVDRDGRPDVLIGDPRGRIGLRQGGLVHVMSGRIRRLEASTHELALAAVGARQELALDAGVKHASGSYLVLTSAAGTRPGLSFGSFTLPLNPDAWFQWTIRVPNSQLLPGSFGRLDGKGRGQAAFRVLNALPATLRGLRLDHAFIVLEPWGAVFASNSVALTLR